MKHKIFRLGPALITVVMVLGSAACYPWRDFIDWPASAILSFGILLGFPAAALWHLVLIVTERPRIEYVLYAISNLFFYAVLGFNCLMMLTGGT
jgi:hypothetical protein